jgi:hypothetical protein
LVKKFYGNGTRLRGHPCPEIAVACGVVTTAIKDMRGVKAKRIRTRIDATVWLASKAAALWFDIAGVEQPYALTGMDWPAHARRLLDGEDGWIPYWDGDESLRPRAISTEQSKVLRDGLNYFDGHRRVDGGTTAERQQ